MGTKASTNSSPRPTETVEEENSPVNILKNLGPFEVIPCSDSILSITLDRPKNTYRAVVTTPFQFQFSSHLSPIGPINLSTEAKDKAKVPIRATALMWAHPDVHFAQAHGFITDSPEVKLAMYGGFVYVGEADAVVGVGTVGLAEGGAGGEDIPVEGPFGFLDKKKIAEMNKQGRFCATTIERLRAGGIERFCWCYPNERFSDGGVISTHGAFVYEHKEEYYYLAIKDNTQPVWEYKDKNSWIAFGAKMSNLLERTYSYGDEVATLTENINLKGFSNVDFKKMLQFNPKTNTSRDIRRIYWTTTQGTASWECLVKKSWKPYEDLINRNLDLAYSSALAGGDFELRLETGVVSEDCHVVNFDEMVQTNLTTGFERKVRRVVGADLDAELKRIPLPRRTMMMRAKLGSKQAHSDTLKPCTGLLEIAIKRGKNLGGGSSCEPFVVITTDFSSKRFATKSLKSSLPEWLETFTLEIDHDNQDGNIILSFYNYKTLSKDIYLGKLVLSLQEIVSAKEIYGWKSLDFEKRKRNADQAEVELQLKFTEIQRRVLTILPPLSELLTDDIKHRILSAKKKNMDDESLVSVNWTVRHKFITELADPDLLEGYHGTYQIDGMLGKGAGGHVKQGRNIQTQEKVAIKVMTKDYFDQERGLSKIRELQMLHTVSHMCIISVIESIEVPETFYIIMELSNGDLMHKLEEGRHEENQAKRAASNLFSALEYLHSIGICHRDVKPENLLCCKGPNNEEVWKLADFGIAAFFTQEDPWITGNIGTPDYMAPEIFLDQRYTKAVDLWAAGVALFGALSALSPWSYTNAQGRQQAILSCDITWHEDSWKRVSTNARDFVFRLIQTDPEERMLPEEALRHKWLVS